MPDRIRLADDSKWAMAWFVIKPRCREQLMKSKAAFRRALGGWFDQSGKDYPWRRTRDPYEILVSEVMLQQTQIATVLGKGHYGRFLLAFPDVGRLAAADDDTLLKAWEGLGYYRRARMLRETARAVVDDHGGRFPSELDALMDLPGIGRYTAGALRAFAFNKPSVLVDGNVMRVLTRLMDEHRPVDDGAGVKRLWQWAEDLADDDHPRRHHSAIMELGQQCCRAKNPDCLSCPVAEFCAATGPEGLPVKRRKTKVSAVDEYAVWLCDQSGRLLLHQEKGKRRTGLWKLPLRDKEELAGLPVLYELKYAITRYRVTLKVHDGGVADGAIDLRDGDAWVDPAEVTALAMAAPFRKAVERLLDGV